jgi:hypothetical protein
MVFFRGKGYSFLPVMTAAGLLDWYIVKGTFDGDQLLDFVQRCVVRLQHSHP